MKGSQNLIKDYNIKVNAEKGVEKLALLSKNYKEKGRGLGSIRIRIAKARKNCATELFHILQSHPELEAISISLAYKANLTSELSELGIIDKNIGLKFFREVFLENKCFPVLKKLSWKSENEEISDSSFYFIMSCLELPVLKKLSLEISNSTFDHHSWLVLLEMLGKRPCITKIKLKFREILFVDSPPKKFFGFLSRANSAKKLKRVKILFSNSAFCEDEYDSLADSLTSSLAKIADFELEVQKVPCARFSRVFDALRKTCLLQNLSLDIPKELVDVEESERGGFCLKTVSAIISNAPFLQRLKTNMVYLNTELDVEMKAFFFRLSELKFLTELSLAVELQPIEQQIISKILPLFVKTAGRLRSLTFLMFIPCNFDLSFYPFFKFLSVCYPETKITLSVRRVEEEENKYKYFSSDYKEIEDSSNLNEPEGSLDWIEDLFSNLLHLSNLEIHIIDFFSDQETLSSLLSLLPQFRNLSSFFFYLRNSEETIVDDFQPNFLSELLLNNPLLQRFILILVKVGIPHVFSQPWSFFKNISLNKYLSSFDLSIISDSVVPEEGYDHKTVFNTFLNNLRKKVWEKKANFLIICYALWGRIKSIKWRKEITNEILQSILNL